MLSLSDSFIEYLAASVTTVPVHWVRVSADDETAHLPKDGHLNVAILGILQNGSLEEALVSLDILGTDERQSYIWAEDVLTILRQQQYTPEFDYTVPSSPAATGRMVSWEADKIRFQVIEAAPLYLHLNATFPVSHAR